MQARFQMKSAAAASGYEIAVDSQPALRLPPGPDASRIYARWRSLHDANDPRADTYLEGIVEGIRFKTVLTGGRGAPPPEAETKADDDEYEADRIRQLEHDEFRFGCILH